MSDVVTLAAALGGTALGGAIGWASEVVRGRGELARRFDADRRHAYARFLGAAVVYANAIDAHARARTGEAGPEATAARRRELERARRELMDPLYEVRLLARPRLEAAANALKDGIDDYRRAHDERTALAEVLAGIDRWLPEWESLRDAVLDAAKAELAIRG